MGRRFSAAAKRRSHKFSVSDTPYSNVQEFVFVFLNQPVVSEAEVSILTDDDMVKHPNLENIADKDQVPGEPLISRAGGGVAGGVIVDKHYRDTM